MAIRVHVLLFFCCCACAIGWSTRCSAQERQSGNYGADTATINRLISVADKVLNPDTCMKLFSDIYEFSEKIGYADGAAWALMIIGIKHYEKEDYEGMREYSKKALPWAKKSTRKDAVAWCYNGIGDAFFNEGDYVNALANYYTSLQELRKSGAPVTHTTVNLQNQLGRVNMRLGQFEKAIGYFREAETLARSNNLNYQLAEAVSNIGDYFNAIHSPDSAERYYAEEMEIGQKMGKVDLEAMANVSLGNTFIEENKYNNAISVLKSAISLAKDHFDDIVTDASYSMGEALLHTGNYQAAEKILVGALAETKKHNIKDHYIKAYTGLVAVYKATGQYKKALDAMDSIARVKDALMSAEKAQAINRMEQKFKAAENNKQKAQNELAETKQKSKLLQRDVWIFSIAAGIFILAIILYALYRNSLHQQHRQVEQIKSLQQENKINILKAVVQGEDKERSRMARELHDGLGGMVSATMMRLMAIRHESENVTKTQAYQDTMRLLEQTADEIRQTAHNLMPEVLMMQTLPDAVRAFCNNMQDKSGIRIDFQSYGEFGDISAEFKLSAYRIIQELIKNIFKHAGATHVLVELQALDQMLTITVEDNGIGFDTGAANTGIGLHNLKTRVNSHNGQYAIDSVSGKGTSVYIEFDLHQLVANN